MDERCSCLELDNQLSELILCWDDVDARVTCDCEVVLHDHTSSQPPFLLCNPVADAHRRRDA
jgi:hypothetical protein